MKRFFLRTIKRFTDITLSLFGIIILSPILVLVCIIQFSTYGKSIFFIQKRVGLNGKIFKVFKFKSMNSKSDKEGKLLPDEFRITKIGKFLRSTSIDELPQLFNILGGSMTIIGPRPQSIENSLFMSEAQFHRHSVKPGLTGLSAVIVRNNATWAKKISLDLDYINRMSIILDMKIIILTIFKVLRRENISTGNLISSMQLGEELLNDKKIDYQTFLEIHNLAKKYDKKFIKQSDLKISS
jgi:undecaprenyl phosphate N,N'-diacetylbacillosamine 1-phosphate transferase